MSLVADGQHYIRNGLGCRAALRFDGRSVRAGQPHATARRRAKGEVFRKRLLDFLNENPASAEVEKAYLKRRKTQDSGPPVSAGRNRLKHAYRRLTIRLAELVILSAITPRRLRP